MTQTANRPALVAALEAAGSAHHEYEVNHLGGARDAQWAGWYAAFVLGRIGDVAAPTQLTRWLAEASGEGEWSSYAADHVLARLGAGSA